MAGGGTVRSGELCFGERVSEKGWLLPGMVQLQKAQELQGEYVAESDARNISGLEDKGVGLLTGSA